MVPSSFSRRPSSPIHKVMALLTGFKPSKISRWALSMRERYSDTENIGALPSIVRGPAPLPGVLVSLVLIAPWCSPAPRWRVTEESNLAAAAIPVRKSRILPAAKRLFVSHWDGRRWPQSPILNFSRFNARLLAWHSPRFMRRVAAYVVRAEICTQHELRRAGATPRKGNRGFLHLRLIGGGSYRRIYAPSIIVFPVSRHTHARSNLYTN